MRTALLLLAAGLPVAAPAFPQAPATAGAVGDTSDERRGLDAVYALIQQRRFAEAQARWKPIAARVQQDVRASSGRSLAPSAQQALQRRFAEVIFIQGLLEARLGRKDDALQQLRQADGYGFPPLDSPLMRLAGECLLELQEPVLAAQAFGERVKAAPADLEARLGLGASLLAKGDLRVAEQELRELLRRRPEEPQAEYYLGAVLAEQHRGAEARGHLERELARDPRCVGCLARLGLVAYLDGDDAACASWLGKAAALDPEDVDTNMVYGMLYNRTGQPALAVQHLSRVVARAPGYAKAEYQLAIAYQRAGDPARAREHREIYDRLIAEQKARSLGVRGSEQ
ncbi:MAG TPA: tetratricopeptide repeat protein [Vicinamibacteria bacterium]|nr:tetratricopeptide repeat protein [Vicinamibacteria bacterium]